MRIALIDYGMSNLRSVANAFAAIGSPVVVVDSPEALANADAIVLPGVGAFADGMRNLRLRGFEEALEEEVRRNGKPFLGLCVGMQVLASTGTEHGVTPGLGWIPGLCERLTPDGGLRVPHIGWNDVRPLRDDGLFRGLAESEAFYFVHSYVLRPEDESVVSGVTEYGTEFAATVSAGNIHATQFHPEKSHRAGLALLANFANIARAC